MLRRRTEEFGTAEAGQGSAPAEVHLVQRIAGGDLRAFEALYRGYHPRLGRFVERVTRRPQLVEEIVNDTMLVVWRKAHSYNLRSKVSTWIFAIAWRKTLKALSRLDEVVAYDPDQDAAPMATGPEGLALRQELRALLSQALAALSAEHRAVIELTYYQGCDCREIAQIMRCPVDTVKTRMFHARRRLKVLLSGKLEGATWQDEC